MKKNYKIKGMECPSCAALLESDLQDLGITAKCSYAKENLEAEIKDDTSEKLVLETIQKSGLTVE
jgi:copper chaperone CopZ